MTTQPPDETSELKRAIEAVKQWRHISENGHIVTLLKAAEREQKTREVAKRLAEAVEEVLTEPSVKDFEGGQLMMYSFQPFSAIHNNLTKARELAKQEGLL